MISITKEFKWAMCHRLQEHKGLCKNLHGHNYKLLLTVVNPNTVFREDRDIVLNWQF